MCPLGYHHNSFLATHALEHMMYGYILLLPMKQRVLNKQSKKRNISGHKLSTTKSTQTSQKQYERNIGAIMKTMSPPGYHHNTFVATPALGHMMYVYTLLVRMNQRVLKKQRNERNIICHK